MPIAINNLNADALQNLIKTFNENTSGVTAVSQKGEDGFFRISMTKGGVEIGSFQVSFPDLDAADIDPDAIVDAMNSLNDKLQDLAAKGVGEITPEVRTEIATKAAKMLFDIFKLMLLLLQVQQKQREMNGLILAQTHLQKSANLLSEMENIESTQRLSTIIGAVSLGVQAAVSVVSFGFTVYGIKAQSTAKTESGVDAARANFMAQKEELEIAQTGESKHAGLSADAITAADKLPKNGDAPREIKSAEGVDVPAGRAQGDDATVAANKQSDPNDPLSKLDDATRKTYFAETDKAKKDVTEAKTELDQAKHDLEQKTLEHSEEQIKLDQKTEELNGLKDRQVTDQDKITANEAEIGRLNAEKQGKETTLEQKRAELRGVQEEMNKSHPLDPSPEYAELKSKADGLRAEITKLEGEIGGIDQSIQAKTDENVQLRTGIEQRTGEIARLETEVQQLEAEVKSGKEAVEGLQTKVGTLQKKYNEACEAYGKALQKDLDCVQANLDKAEQNLEALKTRGDATEQQIQDAEQLVTDIKQLKAFAEAYQKAEDSGVVKPAQLEDLKAKVMELGMMYDRAMKDFGDSAGSVFARNLMTVLQSVNALVNILAQGTQIAREQIHSDQEAKSKEYAAMREGMDAVLDELRDMREGITKTIAAIMQLLVSILQAEKESMGNAIRA